MSNQDDNWDGDFEAGAHGTPFKVSASHASSSSVSGSDSSKLFSSDDNNREDWSSGFDVEQPAFTVAPPRLESLTDVDDDKSNTIKPLRDTTLSVDALRQLAKLQSAGQVHNLGHVRRTTRGSQGDDEDLEWNPQSFQRVVRPKTSFSSHISDDEVLPALPKRKLKSSTSSLASHQEQDDDDVEGAFELPKDMEQFILSSSGSARSEKGRSHSRQASSASSTSSQAKLRVATVKARIEANLPPMLQVFSPGSSTGKISSTSTMAEDDASFFDDLELPAYFDDEAIGTKELQKVIKTKLEQRAAAVPFPSDLQGRTTPDPPHKHSHHKPAPVRAESFEDGLEINEASFLKEKPGIRSVTSPLRSKRAAQSRGFSRAMSDAGMTRSPPTSSTSLTALGVAPRSTSQTSIASASSSKQSKLPRTDSFSGTNTKSLKHKKSTPHLHQAEFETRSLARKRSMPALPRLETPAAFDWSAPKASPSKPNVRRQLSPPSSQRTMHLMQERDKLQSPTIPPAGPSTPAGHAAAIRMTMPTISSKAKQKMAAIAAADPTGRTSSVLVGTQVRSRASSLLSPSGSGHTLDALLKKPKSRKHYGDGTELDDFDDLPTNKDWERKFTRRPLNARAASLDVLPVAGTSRATQQHHARAQSAQTGTKRAATPKKSALGPDRKSKGTGIKPQLIRNLGNSGSTRVEGDMVWNPLTMKWEGNDTALQAFDNVLASSVRPALITPFSGLLSPTTTRTTPKSSATTAGLGGVRVVGSMVFDPVKMCWFNTDENAAEEDELDFGDDEADDFEKLKSDWTSTGDTVRLRGKASFASSATPGLSPQAAEQEFYKICYEAESRHQSEMKHWPLAPADQMDDRSYLWDIRKIIMNEQ